MKTSTVFLALFCLTVVSSHPSSKRGSCLLLCGDDVNRACPSGYECKSNGCGSECFMTTYKQPAGCATFDCSVRCPLGYAKDSQGCLSCKCDYSLLAPGKK